MGEKINRLSPKEVFTDNTQIEYGKQCKNCKNRNKYTVKGKERNGYQKAICAVYEKGKPMDIINNEARCMFYGEEVKND